MEISTQTIDSIYSRSFDGLPPSGDFVECLSLASRRKAVIVGDVAGRGQAANPTARALNAYACDALQRQLRPRQLLEKADEFFHRALRNANTPFASLFVAIFEDDAPGVSYASAGHETAIVVGPGMKHAHLRSTGPVLGLELNGRASFSESTVPCWEDSVLVVVTDGITDARPPGRNVDFFGSRRVIEAVAAARSADVDPARAIYDAACIHARRQLTDDATVIVTRLA